MNIGVPIHDYRLESCRYLHLNFENKPIWTSPALVKKANKREKKIGKTNILSMGLWDLLLH